MATSGKTRGNCCKRLDRRALQRPRLRKRKCAGLRRMQQRWRSRGTPFQAKPFPGKPAVQNRNASRVARRSMQQGYCIMRVTLVKLKNQGRQTSLKMFPFYLD